jgi:hypothetical protein
VTTAVIQPEEWWTTVLRDETLAARLVSQFYLSPQWIHRRVESLDFLDGKSFIRSTSIDLSVPPDCAEVMTPDGTRYSLLPVSMLRKQPLVEFSLVGPDGRSLFNLTSEQNGAIASTALKSIAKQSGVLTSNIELAIDRIVFGDLKAGIDAFRVFVDPQCKDSDRALRKKIIEDETTRWLLSQLATSFLFVVALCELPGKRTVVKYSHQDSDTAGGSDSPWLRTFSKLGWRSTSFLSTASAASGAASYHFEVSPPHGVKVQSIKLYGFSKKKNYELKTVKRTAHSRHIHTTLLPPFLSVTAVVRLRPAWRIWLFPSTVATALTAIVLLSFAFRSASVLTSASLARGSAAVTAPLLLGITGVIATLLTRPGEHALAARLIGYLRHLTITVVSLPFISALMIALAAPYRTLRIWLFGFGWFSAASTVLLALATLMSQVRTRR